MADPVAAVGTMAEEEWGGKKWNGSKWVESNPMGGTSSGRSDPAKAGGGLSGSLLEDGGDTNAQAEDGHSEPYLLWKLALPLLVANVAEELSTIYMYIFWASLGTCTGLSDSGVDCSSEFRNHGLKAASSDCPSGCDYDDGTTQLAAANNMYSGTQFSIVVIFGAQQAVYTMAPQAAGAGANKQVGVILQMVLFWSLVVLGLPTALSWIYMGEAMDALGLIKDDCADNSTTSNSTRHSIQGSADELDLINSYGVASVFYLGPYVLMYSVMTWLESIEEVEWAEPFKAVGSLSRWVLAYLFMWSWGYGLNGYAYASTCGYSITCILLVLVVFRHQGAHKPYWFGWDIAAALNFDLNKRFFWMSLPLIMQYGLQNWANTFFQMLMSNSSCQLAAAYGATGAFTNTGGSVSTAIYVAVSVRVGIRLGNNEPAKARYVAALGVGIATIAGAIISFIIFLLRKPLSDWFAPAGDDGPVHKYTMETVPVVAIYYFLNSVCWGTWAVLQGQMRNGLTMVAMTVGIWGVSVPLSWFVVKNQWMGSGTGDQLKGVWVASCVGEATIVLIMVVAILKSDWVKLCEEAMEYASIGEEEPKEEKSDKSNGITGGEVLVCPKEDGDSSTI